MNVIRKPFKTPNRFEIYSRNQDKIYYGNKFGMAEIAMIKQTVNFL